MGNAKREKLLHAVIEGIRENNWSGLDCVLFPGGFFHLPEYVGRLSFDDRCNKLESHDFSAICSEACERLGKRNQGVLLAAGVDSIPWERPHYDGEDGMDQLCVAWTQQGIAGIGRKVFPVGSPGNEDSECHVCYTNDFSTPHRIITLPSGPKAVLCSCYDMFGCAETPRTPTKRTRYIRCLDEQGILYSNEDRDFRTRTLRCVKAWSRLLAENQVTVGIGAIHYFERPGLDLFWQRHGIASCSATFKGGLAVAAAHFGENLPNFHSSTLASARVPFAHLQMGKHRKANRLFPVGHFKLSKAIVRLYRFEPN